MRANFPSVEISFARQQKNYLPDRIGNPLMAARAEAVFTQTRIRFEVFFIDVYLHFAPGASNLDHSVCHLLSEASYNKICQNTRKPRP